MDREINVRPTTALSGILAAIPVAVLLMSVASPLPQANASSIVKVTGSKYYTNWLYKENLVAARLQVDVRDPKHRATSFTYCLIGFTGAGRCESQSMTQQWRTDRGWAAVVRLRSGWTNTRLCAEIEAHDYRIRAVVEVLDSAGKVLGQGRHVYEVRCAVRN